MLQVGTSSFAASHISHPDAHQHYPKASTPDLGLAAWRPPQGADRHFNPRLAALHNRPESAKEVLKPLQSHWPKASTQEVSRQDKDAMKPQDGKKGGGVTGRPGESISPQESCAQGEATPQQPEATADRKASLARLSRAFQAKKPKDKEETKLAKSIPASKTPGLIEDPHNCSSPPKKQVAWSKSFAKAGFNGIELHPTTKKVLLGISMLLASPCSEPSPIRNL